MDDRIDLSATESQMLIGGSWCASSNGASMTIRNPANHSVVGTVPDATSQDAVAAVDAAAAAKKEWAERTAAERSDILRAWAKLIRDQVEDLASQMTLEQGKPLSEAISEVLVSADFIDWFAEEGRRAYGQVIPAPSKGKKLIVVREPVGIALAITPWNFPASMLARKVAPALAAGCPIILKPSEDAPFVALQLAELAQKAGLPKGVLNVITCSREQAPETIGTMLADKRVRKVSFTGSTNVGKILLEQCAQTVKRTSMELGGNAPFIVFDDADMDRALQGFMASKFRNSGQVCIAPNRLLLADEIHDEFVEVLSNKVNALEVRPGLESGAQVGPVINKRGYDKIIGMVEDALRDGAQIVGGDSDWKSHPLGGTFMSPIVLTNVNPQMHISRDEIFGPVVAVQRFYTETEAIAEANDTDAGLAAYFYTQDADRIWRVSGGLEAGLIGINTGEISNPVAPFGGVKESGLGREGAQSGLLEYLEEKYLGIGTA